MEYISLSKICDVRDGTHDSPQYVLSGYPLVTSKNIVDGKLDLSTVNYLCQEDYDKINARSKVDIGDIIMPMIGTIGNPFLVNEDPNYAIKNVALIKFPNKDISNRFIWYFLKSGAFKKYVSEKNKGGTQKFLSLGDIRNMNVPLISLDNQLKIVERLDVISQIIDKKRLELIALDRLIKARFVELFGHPDLNEKDWKVNTFGEICTVRQGLQIPISKRLTEYEEGCYEYITVQYLHGGKEREYIKDPKRTVICTKDDVLMTRTGNTGMVITGVDGVFHNNFFLIDFDRKKYDKDFLVQYLNLDVIQADIRRRAGTSTIPDLNHGDFYKIQIFEPPMRLQSEFNAFLKQVDKSKVVVQRSLEETQLLFDSLMQRYFGE